MKADEVPVSHLHFDRSNPRHEPFEDDSALISHLLAHEKVLPLAKDIASRGMNPMDKLGVVPMPGNPKHFVVVEGNRRLCAIKLLHSPALAQKSEDRSAFAKLASSASVPATLPVAVFRSREDAKPWLKTRHLGLGDGSGTKPWNARQKARFEGQRSPNALALAVLDYAQEQGWIDGVARKSISITVLTRYLGTPAVRSALGIGPSVPLTFPPDRDEANRTLRRFVLDAVPPADGRSKPKLVSHSTVDQRAEYAISLARSGAGTTPQTSSGKTLPASATPPAIRSRAKHPDHRKHLVPSEFRISIDDKTLHRLVGEGRSIETEDFPFAANYLLRATVERALVLFLKKRKRYDPTMPDQKLVSVSLDLLQADGGVESRLLKSLGTAACNPNLSHSLHTLSAVVHGGHAPTTKDLNKTWDFWEPILKVLLDRC